MKYYILTFGCESNKADAERIEQRLKMLGHKKISDEKSADIIVINACSVRQSAIDRTYGKINRLKNKPFGKAQGKRIILTGCLLEADRKKLQKKVTEIWHPDDYFNLIPDYSNPFSAYVPIMTGCNNFCTYCAVPFTRGRERSRPAKEIINEVKKLIQKGYKEIWLLGQNVNSYQDKIKNINQKSKIITFPALLKELNDIPGDFWIRFTSPHPKDFSNELIKTIAKCEKVTKYINLPVQSGDDFILKKMNRNYTINRYTKLTEKIKKTIPDIALSTDTIVGFPGETKKQFLNTIHLYKKIKFDMAFIAAYSSRPGTAAAITMKDDISRTEKEKRKKELTKILAKTALGNNKKLVGKSLRILVDSKKGERFFGRTEGNKVVEIENDKNIKIGKFAEIKITGAETWKLRGWPTTPKNRIIVILGPTASGKSDLSVELAKKFNGEIISADSRQIYKGMDIGTGKITKKEMKGIKHYLLNVISPKTIFNAANFKKLGEKAIAEIQHKRKIPIICGGTGFYISTLIGGPLAGIKPDWKLREKLEKMSAEELFKMLKKTSKKTAQKIDRHNKRRLIRAIEIEKSQQLAISQLSRFNLDNWDILWLGVKKNLPELKKNIDKRTDKMIKNGLEREVNKLVKKYGWTKTLKNTIGYQEWLEKNSTEKINPVRNRTSKISDGYQGDHISNKIKLHTFQYAKRQITWFKKYAPETKWLRNLKKAEKEVKKFLS